MIKVESKEYANKASSTNLNPNRCHVDNKDLFLLHHHILIDINKGKKGVQMQCHQIRTYE